MADDKQNAFMPDFSGPLSSVLQQGITPQQDQGIQVPYPSAKVSKMAAAAAITDQFLKGLEKGRVRKFAVSQEAKQQKVNAVYANLSRIKSDPNITEEAKAQVEQAAYKSLFGYAQQQMDGDQKGKGKGKGKEPEGMMGHLLGMGRKTLEGFTGGPLPKGTPDIDLGGTLAAMNTVYDQRGQVKPEYSVENQRTTLSKQLDAAAKKDGVFSETSARAAAQQMFPQIEKAYGKDSQRFIENYVRGYPAYSPEQEDVLRRRQGQGQVPPGAQSQATPPGAQKQPQQLKSIGPAGELIGGPPRQGQGQAPPGAAQPQQGYTQAGQALANKLRDANVMEPGSVTRGNKLEEITYLDDHGMIRKTQGYSVIAPTAGVSGFIDSKTGELLPNAQPSAEAEKLAKAHEDIIRQQQDLQRKAEDLEIRDRRETENEKMGSARRKKMEADIEKGRQEIDIQRQRLAKQQSTVQAGLKANALILKQHGAAAAETTRYLNEQLKISQSGVNSSTRNAMLQRLKTDHDNRLGQMQGDLDNGLKNISETTGVKLDAEGNVVPEKESKGSKKKQGKDAGNESPPAAKGSGKKLLDSMVE